ncbi:hypothetical protein NUW58_g3991 [Xylaria curta]|uniref:Uncharacterized protein n=1 Tax=Xylaria curta TaxID=42375 RepID=A0ACC1P8D2_9PEZI|nr:hypothetical protein NUW58_g3991 [Xylaria curta]
MRDVYNLGNSKELASWFAEHITTPSANSRNIIESRASEKEALERIAAVNQLGDTMVMKTSYWQRVWVVQEVCLAQKVFFVYGPTLFIDEDAVLYAHQMSGIKLASGMNNMLKARQRRFSEVMRLETLIEEFAAQMCTDPQDKIYGLIGLANDINAVDNSRNATEGDEDEGDMATMQYSGSEDVDFIIDYRRSFYDIWCDVVQYLFRCPYYFVPAHLEEDEGELARLRHERLTNLIRFAGLVQNTLQDGVERELAQLAASSSASELGAQLRGPKLFGHHLVPARGYLAGEILDLGPSYAAFIGSFRHQTAWRTKWRKHYRKEHELGQLREMEDRYAAKILNYSEADVARVASIQGDSFVAFRTVDNGPLDDLTAARTTNKQKIMQDVLKTLSTLPSKSLTQNAPGGEARRFLGTDRCMGVAPPGAAIGDWVIRFFDCDAAVVVRPNDASDPNTPCMLVGRADVADILDRKGPHGYDKLGSLALQRGYSDDPDHKRFDLVMDWHTLQRITASITT